MKVTTLIFSLLFFWQHVHAQNFQRLNAPVINNDDTLLSPWAGGLSAPQWSKVDLNGDGKMDLYAFDRDGFKHIPFLNTGSADEANYEFAPTLEFNFPSTSHFVLLRDYNRDGVMDFFAHSQKEEAIPGFVVHTGKMENNELVFEKKTFSHWSFDVLTFPLNNGTDANLNVNITDYPAIDDMDEDGDLDILVLNTESGFRITYFRNFSLEDGFTTDTLIFRKEDDCWGNLALPIQTTQFNLSGSADTCAIPFAPDINIVDERTGGLHGASALCTFDEDNDGDKELLYGDQMFPQIMKAFNGGTPLEAFATDQDVTFPSYNAPVHMPDFPAAYYLDFDNDGLNDILVSPNEFNTSSDTETWFYKNIESNEFPVFNLAKKHAMADEMIDIGSGSHPVFFDFNADGLPDIVMGNFQKKTTTNGPNSVEASLYLWENTGTATEPKFELIDDDWLGFKQFSTIATQYAPAFGDIDQDDDLDLFVGEEGRHLFFVENTAGENNPATWGPIIPQWKGINIGNYPTPFIYDINKDGLEDLIIGEKAGNINFLPNIGTVGNPEFHPDPDEAPNNKFLGGITTIQSGTSSGFSAPFILDFTDTVYLVSGSESGFIELYEVDIDKLEFGDTFKLVDKQLGDLNLGTHSRISFANVNDDDFLDAIIGNHRGGAGLFSSPFKTNGTVDAVESANILEFKLFPNPASQFINIEYDPSFYDDIKFLLFNSIGQIAKSGELPKGDLKININSLPNGFYLFVLNQGEKTGIQKFVIQK